MNENQPQQRLLDEINRAALRRMEAEGWSPLTNKMPYLLQLIQFTLWEKMGVEADDTPSLRLVEAERKPGLFAEATLESEITPEDLRTANLKALTERFVHLLDPGMDGTGD